MGLRYTSVSASMVDKIRYTIVNTDAEQMAKDTDAILKAALETGTFKI